VKDLKYIVFRYHDVGDVSIFYLAVAASRHVISVIMSDAYVFSSVGINCYELQL